MTPEDIARYKKLAEEALERAEKATPGAWAPGFDSGLDVWEAGRPVGSTQIIAVTSAHDRHRATHGMASRLANTAFIAAARTDVPELAEAVLRLAAALAHEVPRVRELEELNRAGGDALLAARARVAELEALHYMATQLARMLRVAGYDGVELRR